MGLCQMAVTEDKVLNLSTARAAIQKAAALGANLISLPECWNSPYATSSFPQYAEEIPNSTKLCSVAQHPSTYLMTSLAKEHEIFLIGGSIPERASNGDLFNTCTS